ncbi:MAG: phenylacetate--CoA ligase [Chloroflexi bacterium]|nr:phenylacetate--CoA ligase [Chloroflexota bacterium]
MDNETQSLHEIISHLYAHASAFRARMDDAGLTPDDLETAVSLANLPVFRKDDLIELQKQKPPFGGLLGVPIGDLLRVHQSPGPINEPIPDVPDAGNWAVGLAAAGFADGDVALNAFGYHLTPAGHSFEDSLNTLGCVVIPGGIGNQEQQIQAMAAFGAVGYVGLPSYLKALLDKAEALGIELQLAKAFVLAEPLPPSLRKELNDRGVAVYQSYGTAECGNLGYDVDGYDGWRIPDNVIVQICDINSGQPLPHGELGEVVATLLKPHYAIVRFGVGDLSAIIPESATDGGGLRLKGWLGRVGAATKVRGMFLHPTQLANMMARFPEAAAYQAVITRADHKDFLALHVVPAPNTDITDLADRLQKTARDAIKFRLTVELVDSLPSDDPIRDERTWE